MREKNKMALPYFRIFEVYQFGALKVKHEFKCKRNMKKVIKYVPIIIVFLLSSCTSKEILENIDGTNQDQPTTLPLITTYGSNTFGCLIDNGLYLPRKIISYSSQPSGDPINASYIWSINYTTNVAKYKLTIYISNQFSRKYLDINYESPDLLIEGHTYSFGQNSPGHFNAQYYSFNNFGFATTDQSIGNITIIKFDRVKKILSGTFWFDAFDSYQNSGSKVEVREGRFDIVYDEY